MTEYRGKPLALIDYTKMLYPQYNYKFEKTISTSTWEYLQKETKKKIEETPDANVNVIAHWKSIVNGTIPFGYKISDD